MHPHGTAIALLGAARARFLTCATAPPASASQPYDLKICHPARDLHAGMIPAYFPVVFRVFVLLASHYAAVSEASHIGVQAAATAAGSPAGEKKVSM